MENKHPYKEAINKLLYRITISKPSISGAVNIPCIKTNEPSHDWKAVTRLARYLKGTADIKLKVSPCKHSSLVGYMDASWTEHMNDRKATSGYFFFYGDSLINWMNQKQKFVAQSTAEVECVSVGNECSKLE